MRTIQLSVPDIDYEEYGLSDSISFEELRQRIQKIVLLNNALEEGEKSGYVKDFDIDAHLESLESRD